MGGSRHIPICRWWIHCDNRRRADDHLSFVAGMQNAHVTELNERKVDTLEQFANKTQALDSRPAKGSRDTYDKLHRQAQIQFDGREKDERIYQLLESENTEGLYRLPKPSEGDIYFDIESDRFYKDGGLEYLLGISYFENGEMQYKGWWAFNRLGTLVIAPIDDNMRSRSGEA